MADGSLQSVQHTYHTRILFLKNTTYFYVLYFIIRVSSNSGPLDEQKLDC